MFRFKMRALYFSYGMKNHICLIIAFVFLSCYTLDFSNKLEEKDLVIIERGEYFLYFYPGSEVYIKKDKTNGHLSGFFNICFNCKEFFNLSEVEVFMDDKLVGSVKVSKMVSILNFKFFYINIRKDNLHFILNVINTFVKKITFKVSSDCFQVWTKETIVYDSRYIDIDFKNTVKTLQYLMKFI